ncbi:hypothetical protein QQ045_005972 [Rhodiola kirilowii]
MDLQRYNRVHLDRESRSYVPSLNSSQKLEKPASQTFSFPVFKKIQSEMSDAAFGCAIQTINDFENGRLYIINDAGRNNKLFKILDYMVMTRWHKDAAKKHSRVMFLIDFENPNQTREHIMLSSEIWFHVNAAICSFKNDVDSIQKLYDHISEFVKEHAPNDGVECSSSKAVYFRSVLQMPHPAKVLVNNPGMSRNKGCSKIIRPREIAIEKSKKPLRSCGYCNEKELQDKRTFKIMSLARTTLE